MATTCIVVIALTLNSCKKTNEPGEQQFTPDAQNDLEKMRQQVKDHPEMAAIIFPINQKVPMHFEDENGRVVNSSSPVQGQGNNFTYQCVSPEEMDHPTSATLISTSRFYDCSVGYRFVLTWRISTSVNLTSSNAGGTMFTRGRIRIKDIFGATLYSNTNITPATITLIGDDGSTGNANHIYQVSYTTAWLPFSYFTPNTTVFEHSILAYTDCIYETEDENGDPTNIALSIVSAYASSGLGLDASTPCNRVDPVAVNNAQTGTNNGLVTGFRSLINPCPTLPAVYPDRQQIQIRCIVSGSEDDVWRDISPTSSSSTAPIGTVGNLYPYNSSTQAGTIDPFDFYYFSSIDVRPTHLGLISTSDVHGSYKIRYRNRMMPLSTGCAGDWSAEITRTL
jgi:hypothetical protein